MGTRVLNFAARLRKRLPIHFSFLLIILWFAINKNYYGFVMFVTVVLSHELGHYFVAKKLGYRLDSFFIAPYGVCLNYKEKTFDCRDEVLVALAGPAVNLVLGLITVSLWWAVPELYNFTYQFVMQSALLALFNLLPCYPLDGGRIAAGVLSKHMPRKKAVKIILAFNCVFSVLLFVLFFISCLVDFNPTLCLAGCFLVLGAIDTKSECHYQPMSEINKKIKNFSKPFLLTVNGSTSLSALLRHIEPSRLTVFVVVLKNRTIFLDEQKVKSLSLIYPIYLSLDQIFKQDKE